MKKNKALENKAIQVTEGSIPVTGLIIVPANDTLPIGDELVLQYIFAPEDTTERDYEIGGYNSSVVRVSEDGVVHALADGSTTITVTATNGTKDTSDDKTATCVITVVKHDSRVSEAPAAKNLI